MMKNLIFTLIVVLAISACNQSENQQTSNAVSTDLINNPATAEEGVEINEEDAPRFEFEEKVIEFGEISQGEKIKRIFKFENVGNSDLIISDAKGSCGCTVPLWPKNPIAPGEEGEVEVVFDSNGKQGRQNKTITLIANTIPNKFVIALKGDVLAPEQTKQEQ